MDKMDIIVVGGGPAGFSAAVAAARMGARTLLVEQYGMLGGAMTVGGVRYPMTFSNGRRRVVAGVGWELMERLITSGWAYDKDGRTGELASVITLDPVMAACEMDVMAREAGVEILFGCKLASAVAREGRVTGASFAAPEGLIELEADMWIDCTGDGQLAYLAGAEFEMGDPQTRELQPGSQGFWMDGFDPAKLDANEVRAAFFAAREAGKLLPGDFYGEAVWPATGLFEGHGMNANHVEMDLVTARARTAAALEGHMRVSRTLNWAREFSPGTYGVMLSPEPWPRESRRILGREYVSADDYRAARKYADGICYSYYPMDLHKKPREGADAFYLEAHTLSPDNVPSIPLGALMPRGFNNLMVAGRSISGDRMAQSAYRVQAPCMGMGQAAGVMCALCVRGRTDLDGVSAGSVRAALAAQGAVVPE